MKVIERFEFSGRAKRTYRNSGVILNVVKHGAKKGLAKINPALLVLDAVVSLVDFGISYVKYKKEKETHKILVKKLETVKYEYQQKRKFIEEDLKNFQVDIDLAEENFMDVMKKEREKLSAHYDVLMELKESLIFLKEIYYETNDIKDMEKVLEIQSLFIELLIQ